MYLRPLTTLAAALLLPTALPAQGTVIQEWLGDATGDEFGFAVDGAGDVDGDGVPDVIIGADRDDDAATDAGRVSVYSGRTGLLLHRWDGSGTSAFLGADVAGVGDVDQDGFDDVLFSETYQSNLYVSGQAYLRSGRDGALIAQWSAGPKDQFGYAVAGLGDITGDAVPDVAVSAITDSASGSYAGRVYLYDGATFQVIRTHDGPAANAFLGYDVAGGHDLDQDGVPDVVIGSPMQGNGQVDVFSGATGALLYTVTGLGQFGRRLDLSPDLDGDGVADLIVGDSAGKGHASLLSGVDGSLILAVEGEDSQSGFGYAVAALGDTDFDGVPDFAVGAYAERDAGPGAGIVRVFSGSDGAELIRYHGNQAGANLGWSVAGTGDVDGDGSGDLVVGATPPWHSANFPGYVRVYSGACLGSATPFGSGLGGTGGFVPGLSAQGCPGRTALFGITIDQVLGGARGFLLLAFTPSSVPFAGGTLYVLPPWILQGISTPGGGPGNGRLVVNVIVPDNPALVNVQLYAQAVFVDAGAVRGLSLTNGLSILFR